MSSFEIYVVLNVLPNLHTVSEFLIIVLSILGVILLCMCGSDYNNHRSIDSLMQTLNVAPSVFMVRYLLVFWILIVVNIFTMSKYDAATIILTNEVLVNETIDRDSPGYELLVDYTEKWLDDVYFKEMESSCE